MVSSPLLHKCTIGRVGLECSSWLGLLCTWLNETLSGDYVTAAWGDCCIAGASAPNYNYCLSGAQIHLGTKQQQEGHGNKQICWVSTASVAPVSSWHCHPVHLSSTTPCPCLLDCWPLLQSYDMHCSVLPDMLRHKNRRSHSRFLHSSSLDGCNCKWSI